ncbi:MAG: DUF1330 domain-containing protein [Methylibium sp.]|uniref:DUF1330 domain-containing protein n=1 Tax=Methylibium sp. TaxID=2067992 RepID=UPI0017ED28F2|nr:DUF1330 domain-containing protein [Methylibium sp.]MBA3598384.1 DUF1330 domain-containing protein [Methylibium sp.]
MSAYIIATVRVTDAARYEDYKTFSSLAMHTHGAEVLVRGGMVGVLEGDWTPERVIVMKFGSVAQARAFYDSTEYAKAKEARADAAVMQMIVVEGTD